MITNQASPSSTRASLTLENAAINSKRDTNISISNQSPRPDAKEILKKRVAFGALFNSAERFNPPQCHPHTREAILNDINTWAKATVKDSRPILWLRGAMGAGKSAIAQTSAEKWANLKILAASFFFSRTIPGRNNSSQFVATLAYQISLSIPSTWPLIENALLHDVGLFEKSLRTQITELLVDPIEAVASEGALPHWMVILVDGLDECCLAIGGQDHEAQQKEILDTISEITRNPRIRLRFIVVSRPERQIRSSFEKENLANSTQSIDLSMVGCAQKDIQIFVECNFNAIRQNNDDLGPSWPSQQTIDLLVEKSSDHFIYASTVMKYISRPRHDPQDSLQAVLNAACAENTPDSPFAALDALYSLILDAVVDESRYFVRQIFRVLVFGDSSAEPPFSSVINNSPKFMEKYLLIPPRSSYRHLVDLHSILRIPERCISASAQIQFVHASFSEFLANPSRSQSFLGDKFESLEEIQTHKIKHIIIQAISPRAGRNLGYKTYGPLKHLCHQLCRLPPSDALINGLLALSGDNCRFDKYLSEIKLTHIGKARDMQSMLTLFQPPWSGDVYSYMSKCGFGNAKVPFSKNNLEKMLATSFEPTEPENDAKESTFIQENQAFISDLNTEHGPGPQDVRTLEKKMERKAKRMSPYPSNPTSITRSDVASHRVIIDLTNDDSQGLVEAKIEEEPTRGVSAPVNYITIDLTGDDSD